MELILGAFLKVSDKRLIQLSHISDIMLQDNGTTQLFVGESENPVTVDGDVIAFLCDLEDKNRRVQAQMASGLMRPEPGVLIRR